MNRKNYEITGGGALYHKGTTDGFRQSVQNEDYLGTTRIFGPIRRVGESEQGFSKARLGVLGTETQKGIFHLRKASPLIAAEYHMTGMISGLEAVDGPVEEEKLPIPDPDIMSQHIKDTVMFLRGDDVGIGILPPYAVYSHKFPTPSQLSNGERSMDGPYEVITNDHKYAISIIIDQNLTTLLSSTGYDGISSSQSYMAYLQSGVIACTLAAYIRNLGYSARAHHCGNYQVVVPPILVASGLGEMSRTGECALHPRFGLRFKAAVVTTDLPLKPDQPIDFGGKEFCANCMKCAEHCPSGAISRDKYPSVHNNYEKWATDSERCTKFRVNNIKGSMCGRCMKVCPWSNKEDSWFHHMGTSAASKSAVAARMLKGIDDIFGYGTEVIGENRWWLEWPELWKR